jgi:hypothetical protein
MCRSSWLTDLLNSTRAALLLGTGALGLGCQPVIPILLSSTSRSRYALIHVLKG